MKSAEKAGQAFEILIYRQMLKMNGIPEKEFTGNARGINLKQIFQLCIAENTAGKGTWK